MKTSFGGEWFEDFFVGFTAYYLTSLPVLVGVLFGGSFIQTMDTGGDPVSASVRNDAYNYLGIIREGYSYDPTRRSSVAFFPAYPLLSRCVSRTAGLAPEEASLVTAHAALLGAFVLLARWTRSRWQEATMEQRGIVLAVFGLWPMGLFFRMPYAESLFVCVMLALLYGMARGWPLWILALTAGLGTAIRPVGVALAAAFLWHTLTQPGLRWRTKAGQILLLAPLACWGLLAYMGYQWLAFGTPWAFAQTQKHWIYLGPESYDWSAKLWSLMTLEPIWGVYVPDYPRYWGRTRALGDALFNLNYWNPILFVMATALLLLGGWKRWISGSELVLGVCLLGIPYLTRSYEMSMASHGRFAAVVVLNYLVIGRFLARTTSLGLAAVCSALAIGLYLFTALYVANYPVF